MAKLNAAGSALVFSTYLGGSLGDSAAAIAVDREGNVYVAGSTVSTNFPTARALRPTYGGDPAFAEVWASTDLAVQRGQTNRSWLWGPAPYATLDEPYAQSPGGKRLVEYYDKARMEINNPSGDRSNRFFVTNGLLPIELITGRLKTGDAPARYERRAPAGIPVAGDAPEVNPNAPTYGSFAQVATVDVAAAPRRDPSAVGALVVATLNKAGQVGQDRGLSRYDVRVGRYHSELDHNVPEVFQRYLDSLPLPAIFALGHPISEPYWARVRVGGVEQDVLMQAYERRVLTYTPGTTRKPSKWRWAT